MMAGLRIACVLLHGALRASRIPGASDPGGWGASELPDAHLRVQEALRVFSSCATAPVWLAVRRRFNAMADALATRGVLRATALRSQGHFAPELAVEWSAGAL